MKRLMVVGLITCLLTSSLVSCGNKKEEIKSEEPSVQEELKVEEEFVSEFLKTDLNEEERVELFKSRMIRVKDVYNKMGIKLQETDYALGLTYNGNESGYLTMQSLLFIAPSGNSEDGVYSSTLNVSYDIYPEDAELYRKGEGIFNIADSEFPALFRESTGMKLDTKRFNEIVFDLFQDKIGDGGVGDFDVSLDEIPSDSYNDVYFMQVRVTDYDVAISLNIPLRREVFQEPSMKEVKNPGSSQTSNLTPKEHFEVFIRSNLNEEEKTELFDDRKKTLSRVFDKHDVEYAESDGRLSEVSSGKYEDMSLMFFNFAPVDNAQGGEFEDYMLFSGTYYLKENKGISYGDGTASFDVSDTEFPEIFTSTTGMDLDVEKFNKRVSEVYQSKIGPASREKYVGKYCAFDYYLDEVVLGDYRVKPAFVYVECLDGSLKIELRIPYREEMKQT